MSAVKKDRWTEMEVLALPTGEHDYFDRKSGALLNSPDFRKDLAKALSAFANSGGGHLVLGITDAGAFDGIPPKRGRTPTREWLEQIIPNLLTYPLEDFRVHEVIPDTPSTIPDGMVVLVVDVGDSALAPHQTQEARTYYYREGGHSKPAPHFYLETLRNRLVNPALSVELVEIEPAAVCEAGGSRFVGARLIFRIENIGRVAAYKWALVLESYSGNADGRASDYQFDVNQFPEGARSQLSGGISLDDTILPSLSRIEKRHFGCQLRGAPSDNSALNDDLRNLLSEFELCYHVVTETSRGEPRRSRLATLPGVPTLLLPSHV